MSKIRYTLLAIQLNTNKAARTANEEALYMNALKGFIETKLSLESTWRNLLNIEPSFSVVEKIAIDAIGLEIGGKMKRIHVHMTVLIQHRGTIHYKGMQEPIQDLFNMHVPWIKGSYARVDLLSARHLNYTTKFSDTDTVYSMGMQDEVFF